MKPFDPSRNSFTTSKTQFTTGTQAFQFQNSRAPSIFENQTPYGQYNPLGLTATNNSGNSILLQRMRNHQQAAPEQLSPIKQYKSNATNQLLLGGQSTLQSNSTSRQLMQAGNKLFNSPVQIRSLFMDQPKHIQKKKPEIDDVHAVLTDTASFLNQLKSSKLSKSEIGQLELIETKINNLLYPSSVKSKAAAVGLDPFQIQLALADSDKSEAAEELSVGDVEDGEEVDNDSQQSDCKMSTDFITSKQKISLGCSGSQISRPQRSLSLSDDNEPMQDQNMVQGAESVLAMGAFVCKECGDQFEHGQALGGHMSRKHPGQSQAFNRKIQRRKEREFERELLQYAKQKHSTLYGADKPIDRVKIRRFRKEMRKQYQQTGRLEI